MRRKARRSPWARRRWRSILALALAALLFAPWLVWRVNLKAEVRQSIEALRADGVPVTEEAYAAWYARFPELTYIDDYQKACEAYVLLPYEVSNHLPSFRPRHESPELFLVPYGADTLEALRQAVALNAETLQLLGEARARFAGGVAIGGYCNLEDELVELYCANTCVKADAGDGAGALGAILDGLVFLKARNTTPWSDSLWRAEASVARLMCALGSAAGRTALPDAQLGEIQAMLAAPDWEEEMRSASIQRTYEMIRDIPSMLPDAPEAHVVNAILGQLDQHLVRTLRSQRLRLALIGKSVAEQRAEFGNLRRRGRTRDFSISGPPVHLAVAAAGIEVIRFRQTHGELPASLEEVARDGLELDDFYMEKPFAYTQDGNSFTVYSAGADQKDDGGSGRADVVFRACFPHR